MGSRKLQYFIEGNYDKVAICTPIATAAKYTTMHPHDIGRLTRDYDMIQLDPAGLSEERKPKDARRV